MTLIIQKPTGAKVNLAQTYVGIDDPDAAVYVAAVEAADGQSLETATKVAIHSFVKGCKADGIWPAIKASCILAGARTLAGALVPLVGTAPTNVGGLFVSGDYNRETGLVGDGSTKYLDSNRNNNADLQDSKHVSSYCVSTPSGLVLVGMIASSINGASIIYPNLTRLHSSGSDNFTATSGFIGLSRNNSLSYTRRNGGSNTEITKASLTPQNSNIAILRNGSTTYGSDRLAFYSIGESLDLALLDARVTDLINAFAAAIP